jgi:hypothetical protein
MPNVELRRDEKPGRPGLQPNAQATRKPERKAEWCEEYKTSQNIERYSKPHVIEKKKSARVASNASW